jgi:hypothetical protein
MMNAPLADSSLDDCFLLACKGDSLPDSVGRVLITLLLQNPRPKELDRCAVYLFQTTCSHLRKYGISKDPKNRRKTAKGNTKNRYVELLSERWCESRLQAVCFEGALSEAVLHMGYSEEDKAELSFCAELTQIEAAEFDEYMELFMEDWAEKGPLGFVWDNCRKAAARVQGLADALRKGSVEPALDLAMNNRLVFVQAGFAGESRRFKGLSVPGAIKQMGLEGWEIRA